MGTGTTGGNNICGARYSDDVDSANSDRIASEYGREPMHRALLASEDSEGGLPQNFDIPNKENRAVQLPNQDPVSRRYGDFFIPGMDTTTAIPANGVSKDVWTGLQVSGNSFVLGGAHCQNWTIKDPPTEKGWKAGEALEKTNDERLKGTYDSGSACLTNALLICISY